MMVVNDVILFYPIQAEPVLEAYAVEYGLDWHQALQASTGGIDALFEIETKETTIQHQHGLLTELRAALLEKEQLIAALEAERSSLSARLAAAERGLLWRVALSLAHRVRRLAGGRERRQRPAAR